jgi:hypothetical protein
MFGNAGMGRRALLSLTAVFSPGSEELHKVGNRK